MKKKIYAAALLMGAMFIGSTSYAQIQDEQNVTVTMDLQPVLQLYMTTSDQINFTFNSVQSYQGGEIQYGATILKVSSTVDWDLYAVGTSTNGATWDNQLIYGTLGTNATTAISLAALELHQTPTNPDMTGYAGGCAAGDYSTPFAPATALVAGQNNIYVNANPYTAPALTDKYIAGEKGTGVGQQVTGGSYLQNSTFPSNFYYVIDYRILPGLPVVFPADVDLDDCTTADPNAISGVKYAQAGVYTMDVKYVLLEDQ